MRSASPEGLWMKMCVGKSAIQQFEAVEPLAECDLLKIKYENDDNEKVVYTEDVLSLFTYYTKAVVFGIGDLLKEFQNSKSYKVLFHTTQPAHFVITLAISAVAYLVFSNKDHVKPSPLLTFLYLMAVSTHFGSQIWMTFVSGLSLYFCLPRHTFGSVQRILFPKYFLLNSALSLLTLTIFIQHNNPDLSTSKIFIQTTALALCFLTELIIRLYLTPPLLSLMEEKNNLEKEVGVGMEVGKLDAGVLLKSAHYLKIHKAFRRVHMSVAMGNIITMGCTVLHLQYLSSRICVL